MRKTNAVKPAPNPAEQRKAWAKSRLAILDARLGVNIGAKRERVRLWMIINTKP